MCHMFFVIGSFGLTEQLKDRLDDTEVYFGQHSLDLAVILKYLTCEFTRETIKGSPS